MYRLFFVAIFVGVMCLSLSAKAATLVRVMAYPFPPFLNDDMKTGLTPDLLALFNRSQDDFQFELHVTSPKRRYRNLENNLQDMILFEMPQWGWAETGLKITSSREIMRGGEVYITSNSIYKNQTYFEDLTDKSISAYFGYHYGFANFNADRAWLEKNFKIALHNSHERIIDLVALDKSDIGVVTFSYLRKHLTQNPEKARHLIVSEKFDQIYSLRAIFRENASISVLQFEKMMQKLKESGQLQALFKANGLEQQLTF